MNINTGKGFITLKALLAIWSVSALTSLPGLAVSPILDKLTKIFPAASEFELQMLTSLPSLLIIPFVLLSGRWAEKLGFMRMLALGLWIFLLSGILYLLCNTMWQLIVVSALLGVGAGIIIPLSTALVSRYFVGDYRTRQFGYSSAITNATLVVATALTGYLAELFWRLPFTVYLLPIVSILLIPFLSHSESSVGDDKPTVEHGTYKGNKRTLTLCSLYYLFITYLIVAINVNLSFLMGERGFDSSTVGIVTSLFFLAIMLPGFLLSPILQAMKGGVASIGVLLIGCGLLMVYVYDSILAITLGCLVAGFGYGVAQPYIYDRVSASTLRNAAFALAIVMSMNYIAIVIAPVIVDFLQDFLHIKSQRFAFGLNAGLAFVAFIAIVSYNLVYRNNLNRRI